MSSFELRVTSQVCNKENKVCTAPLIRVGQINAPISSRKYQLEKRAQHTFSFVCSAVLLNKSALCRNRAWPPAQAALVGAVSDGQAAIPSGACSCETGKREEKIRVVVQSPLTEMGWVGGKELLDKHPWGHHQNPPNNPSSRLMSAAPVLLSAQRGERMPAPYLPYTRIFRHLKLNFFSKTMKTTRVFCFFSRAAGGKVQAKRGLLPAPHRCLKLSPGSARRGLPTQREKRLQAGTHRICFGTMLQ